MKLGIYGINESAVAAPAATARLARLAEELGYESWWAGEHLVLPRPRVAASPMEPDYPILDPIVHLAFVAALTTTLRLGAGIVILPARNPVILAKEVASLDVLCGGRLELGIGAGYLEAELNAAGVPMHERGARLDEHLDAMRALWASPARAHSGRFSRFDGVDAHPKPVRGAPRIVVGGHSAAALRRAARHGDGWFGAELEPAETAAVIAQLRRICETERAAGREPLEISLLPQGALDRRRLEEYRDAGVDRVVVYPFPPADEAEVARFMEAHATLLP